MGQWLIGRSAMALALGVAGLGLAAPGAQATGLELAQAATATASTGARAAPFAFDAQWSGWFQFNTAYTYASPGHLSAMRLRGELAGSGRLGEAVKWKLSLRAGVDPTYGLTSFYPAEVRRDQQAELALHEAYVDFGRGDWEFRLGKQNIVWGEMVGLFFADVVSAKDLREYVLPEFNLIRVPQWAARAEWYGENTHLEFIWLPSPAVDLIGKPGAEFYPYPRAFEGFGYEIRGARKPSRSLSNSGLGVRASALVGGWDLSAFVYRAPDTGQTFYRSLLDGPLPTVSYQAGHDRITRVGATMAKDFDGVVAKAEVIHTSGRQFSTVTLDAGNGLRQLDTLDWVAGLDFTPAADWRFNIQLFQRVFLDHDPAIGLKRYESGASVLVSHALTRDWDAEVLAISSLVRRDWMLRAAAIWKAGKAGRLRAGVDAFGGEAIGLFGGYGNRDRAYVEYRHSF